MAMSKRQTNEAQRQRQARLLETIRRRRFAPPAAAPDSTELLRPIGRDDAGGQNFLSRARCCAIMIPGEVEIR
jgi:hypothetical protein